VAPPGPPKWLPPPPPLTPYTEIGSEPDEPVESVDLNLVLVKVIENLQASIESSGAAITSDPLPALAGHEGHFIPLFQNLVGNAIKYRSDLPPRIHISVQQADGQYRFTVSDNGIGIDLEYHERIFEVFRRLHGRKIPGTGIGLSICQRVVERYGGRIWVESSAGHGSTFIFTVPRTDLAATHPGTHPGKEN
jgi:signal transduction histidine kinase